MATSIALTGAAAAALWGLEGFRGHDWQPRSCAPHSERAEAGLLRTRRWREPTELGGVPVVRASVALHHVGLEVRRVPRWPGDTVLLGEDEVVELAIEDALRRGLATPIDLRIRGGAMPRTTFVRS